MSHDTILNSSPNPQQFQAGRAGQGRDHGRAESGARDQEDGPQSAGRGAEGRERRKYA